MLPLPGGLHAAHERSQLEATIGADRVQAALADGLLQRYSAAVLVERCRFADFRTRAAAALLHAGPRAALTGESVFAIAGFASASSAQVEVLLPDAHRVRRRPALVIHSAEFSEIDVEVHEGLRLMAPDYALAELLCRNRGFACLDEALARCPTPRRDGLRASVLARIMARPDTVGRSRARFLADLGTGRATCPAESRLLLLTVDAGWPAPHQHYPLRNSSGRALYRLPLAWPHARVAIATPPDATTAPGATPADAAIASGALAVPGVAIAPGATTAPDTTAALGATAVPGATAAPAALGAAAPGAADALGHAAVPRASGPADAPGTPAAPGTTDARGTAAEPGSAAGLGTPAAPGSASGPGVSAAPGAFAEPETSAGPGGSSAPGASAGPGAFAAPGAFAEPETSAGPGGSSAPGAFAGPGASAGLGAFAESGTSAGPGGSSAPGASAGPGASAAPSTTAGLGPPVAPGTAAQDEDLWRRGWTILRPTEADLLNPSRFLADLHMALTEGGLAA
ncbi:hypothetical protein YIM_43055 [Amycolatopsis sp. YIM 10]|nr:hypothetical protein YIM_43055 [Amycolatopsis sp. YIM 10]